MNTKLIVGRLAPRAVAYKNFIYIIGGKQQNGGSTNCIEKFDTRTGEIIIIQEKLQVPRCYFAIAKNGHLVYIMGGYVAKNHVKSVSTKLVEIFNLSSETVEEGKSLPFENSCFTAHIV